MERVSELHRSQMLQSYNMILSMDIVDLLNDIVIEQGFGCSVDHLSQTQLPCIMETPLTHLEMYFKLIFERVNKVTIMKKWQKEIAVLNIPFESVKAFNELMISSEIREKYLPLTKSWKGDIYKLVKKW